MAASILVVLNDRDFIFAPLAYAEGLAERLKAKVRVLVVLKEGDQEKDFFEIIQPLIENYQAKGVMVECFFTAGDFIEEVVKFAQEQKADITVFPSLPKEDQQWRNQLKELQRKLQSLIIFVNKKIKKGGMPVRKEKLAQVSIKTKQKEGK